MSTMKAGPKVVFVWFVAAILTGCSAPAAPSGVLTGKAWPCVGIVVAGHPLPLATVWVFRNGHRVASQTLPAGSTYRIKLRSGRYVVTNAGSAAPSPIAREIFITSGKVTRVNLPNLCP